MISSGINCSEYTEISDLELQSEISEICSSEGEDIIHENHQKIQGWRSPKGSISLLSNFKNLMAPLIFLGTLTCAAGGRPSSGWQALASDLCNLIYVKGHFDSAALRGEYMPSINVTGILNYILNKASVSSIPGSNETLDLRNMNAEQESETFYFADGYVSTIVLGLVFNRTGILPNKTTSQLIEEYERLKEADQVEQEYPHNVIGYPLSNYSIVSNVSKMAFGKILYARRAISKLRYEEYCPNISKYIPIDKYATSGGLVTIETPKSNIEPESDPELTAAIILLNIVGISFLAFYVISRLGCRNCTNSTLRRRIPEVINVIHPEVAYHRYLLSEVTEEEEVTITYQ
ncbi:hypothetical protein [Candidatus Ichthyocystis hellenicum]|uniref:hypothetical protein n=1 Tax=Candidatus Ichthyocystis hellenicum TaxID=1561003 RepID=UPI000B86A6F7|nr:hypothetical protein [Candidatus Ichthyocystis hellenicum]